MNWLTIVVIVFLIAEVLIGLKKGFVKMALSLFAMIIALVITSAAGPYVKSRLNEYTSWQTNIQTSIQTSFDGYLEEQVEAMEPEQENEVLDKLPIPEVLTGLLKDNNNSSVYEKLGVDTLTGYVSAYLANMIMTAIAYVVTFIIALIVLKIIFHFLHLVTRIPGLKQLKYVSAYLANMIMTAIAYVVTFIIALIVLKIIFHFLHLVTRIPGLKQLNSVAGGILALVQGLIFLWILCLVLTAFSNTDWGIQMMGMIKESSFLSLIYNHNLLLQLLMEIMMNL